MSTVTITEEPLAFEDLLAVVDGAQGGARATAPGPGSRPAGRSWTARWPATTPYTA